MKLFMTTFKSLLLLAVIALGMTSNANAGFLIEPFIDYAVSGKAKSGSDSDDVSSTLFGARLGLTTLGFMYGLEYNTGNYTVEDDTGDSDGKVTNMGAFVGYEFPVMFRVWATYYFDSTATPDPEGNSDFDMKGSGMRFGIGYTGLPYLSINLQYMTTTYDEVEGTVLGFPVNTSLTDELKMETVLLGISVPLP